MMKKLMMVTEKEVKKICFKEEEGRKDEQGEEDEQCKMVKNMKG